MSKDGWKGQFARFVLVGVLNTAVGLGTIFALISIAGWSDVPANALGYVAGLCCSFLLNRSWTFRHQGRWQSALGRFLLVFVLAYSVNLAALFFLVDVLLVDRFVGHALATVPYTLTFFWATRQFAFKADVPLRMTQGTDAS